mgnify:FL=1|jgi:hypothetical protein
MINRNIDLRATSGSVVNAFRTGYKVQVVWTVNSQDPTTNTSNVTFKCQLVSSAGYTISSSATQTGTVTINGTKYSFTYNATLTGGQTKTLYTKTLDIKHNSDGTKSCDISATFPLNVYLSGKLWTSVTATGIASFNTIPRVSTFTINTTDIILGSTAVEVTINKSSSAFTHKLYYKLGSISKLLLDSGATSVTFTPSISDCNELPNSITGAGEMVLETYSNGTKMGQTTTNFVAHVPTSVKPTFTEITTELIPVGINSSVGYVQNKSKCKLSVKGAEGVYGSTITNYVVKGGNYSSNVAESTTGLLTEAGTISFTAYVVDSRGRQSATKTVSIQVQPYTNPKILELSARRSLSNGLTDEDGTYAKVYTNYSFADIGGSNSVRVQLSYRKTGDSNFTVASQVPVQDGAVVIGGSFETTSAYEIKFTLSDNFTTVEESVIVATSFVTLDFLKGGKGIAIGKTSEKEGLFDINMDVAIKGRLSVNGVDISSGGSSGGSSAPVDTTKLVTKAMVNGLTGDKNDIYNKIPYVASDGSMEVGQYIDFHLPNTSTDYSGRLALTSANTLKFLGNFYSTGNLQAPIIKLDKSGKIVASTGKAIITDKGSNNISLTATGGALSLGESNTTKIELGCHQWDVGASSGTALMFNPKWSGSKGTEISLWNNLGKGWGYLGGVGYEWYRVYGTGGSVSKRSTKYDIQKFDNEYLYNTVKDLNTYGYRTISDIKDEADTVSARVKRSDMQLGCMIDELPMEVVLYDNEGGDGGAVDNYAYTTLVLGAVKHLQQKVESLESEKEALEQRLLKLEGVIYNGIN